MKRRFLYMVMLLCMTIFLWYCSNNETDKTPVLINEKHSGISIQQLGEASFRRSLAGVQFLNDSVEQEQYIKEQMRLNPSLNEVNLNEPLLNRLNELGLIKDTELILTAFSSQSKKPSSSLSIDAIPLTIRFERIDMLKHKAIIYKGKDSSIIQIEPAQEISYAWLDINPGGLKELVTLGEFYFMNGYNYSLAIYEIRN